MSVKHIAAALFTFTVLAGCLDNDLERGVAGAAAGAVISDATGGSATTGAIIGGAAGVFCDDVNICN
ncbi:hypothetical protein [Thalassobius sp. I31.1]|uniref:hypothetical protein n=1 Tax=Thalassobius sp. I31.1 TaxID=2109912 RepID=UPI000D1A028A|nr:hypothetical protein [Thalassobius sp. I31.1]